MGTFPSWMKVVVAARRWRVVQPHTASLASSLASLELPKHNLPTHTRGNKRAGKQKQPEGRRKSQTGLNQPTKLTLIAPGSQEKSCGNLGWPPELVTNNQVRTVGGVCQGRMVVLWRARAATGHVDPRAWGHKWVLLCDVMIWRWSLCTIGYVPGGGEGGYVQENGEYGWRALLGFRANWGHVAAGCLRGDVR